MFARRFATGTQEQRPSSHRKNGTVDLYRDAFGLRKVILAVGANHKVYAIDSANGEILYTRTLSSTTPGATLVVVKLLLIRTVVDSPTEQPEVVLIVNERDPQVSNLSPMGDFVLNYNPLGPIGNRRFSFPGIDWTLCIPSFEQRRCIRGCETF